MADFKEILAAAEELTNGKEFLLSYVAGRLQKAASRFPHNHAIRTMESLVHNRLRKAGEVGRITQYQLQDVFNQVSGLGSIAQVRECIDDLLFTAKPVVASYENKSFVGGLRNSGDDLLPLADEEQVQHLKQALFDAKPEPKIKRASLENGRRGVQIELESFGISHPNVEIAASDENFVIYAAEVTTRRGKIPFLIPAEIKQSSVLLPSIFVAGNTFVDLTNANIRALLNHADVKKTASPKEILDSLNKMTGKSAGKTAVASIDPQLTVFAAPETFAEIQDFGPPEQKPHVPEMPEALREMSDSALKETLIEAGLSYPRDLVVLAKKTLSNEIKLARLNHDKIQVESEFSGGIILSTNLVSKHGKKKIEVPLEINSGRVCLPARFTSGAFASAFSEDALQAFAASNKGDGFSSLLTNIYDMSFTELHKTALNKASYQDFVQATECLSVIYDKFGHDFYRVAHDDLMELLKAGYSEEKTVSAMDKFIAAASEKAKNKEEHIKINSSSMLFYPRD